ncbi:hypothetical protein [Desulfopila inferna]|uniref:hypothetical protein n=1 Tax=Desulfopila inferna TaxID=468528 RepID=UPI001965D96B|nr:hypothetical protein [Desulfopila inferna]MBM9604848.1 hypothetical protein [Desulfopila inferna]
MNFLQIFPASSGQKLSITLVGTSYINQQICIHNNIGAAFTSPSGMIVNHIIIAIVKTEIFPMGIRQWRGNAEEEE